MSKVKSIYDIIFKFGDQTVMYSDFSPLVMFAKIQIRIDIHSPLMILIAHKR